MVRRLLIALVAVLALAWPAAANPLDPTPLLRADPSDASCPVDQSCQVASPVPNPLGAVACKLADLGTSNDPGLKIDPDGCIQRFLHKTIGWADYLGVMLADVGLPDPFADSPSE